MIGVDTGGTFTDVIAANAVTGELRTVKVSSTPADPSKAVLAGLQGFLELDARLKPQDISFFAHGTTVATNAVIERKGARTGLLITAGMNAIYPARQSKQAPANELLNPNFKKTLPLIPGRLTREVRERIARDGSIIEPLNEGDVVAGVRDLVDGYDIDSIAVCYLFSFMAPAHEKRTREIINAAFPKIRVSLSSEILPVIREYRRLSTTALDAFVGPTLERYLGNLRDGLASVDVRTRQIFIMQSNGGLMSIDVARSNPVQTLLSGPAAGVIAGRYLSSLTGYRNVVTFDVGGTSTDIAVIIDGEVLETTEGSVAGHDCAVPMNEIATIGAGGGTIARVGVEGRLKVGPDSAGADPGPACYAKGGVDPTVTDADVVLGYLDPDAFLGGRLKLDRNASVAAITKNVGEPLSLTLERAAAGIVRIINSHMEGELRLSLMGRGLNPRDFALVAIGGGGPVRASTVAKSLGIRTVIVPPYPGLGSAMGLLLTDIRHTYLQSKLGPLASLDQAIARRIFDDLESRARLEAQAEGSDAASLDVQYFLELRYVGQGYELSIKCDPSDLTDVAKTAIRADYDALHERTYGHSASDSPLEVVNFRVDTLSPLHKLKLATIAPSDMPLERAIKGRRQAFFEETKGYVTVPVYDRNKLARHHVVDGPAIVEQLDTTIVVIPGQRCAVDDHGNLILSFAVEN